MGNGAETAATVYDRIRVLMHSYETLSGLQQPRMATEPPESGRERRQRQIDEQQLRSDVKRLVRDLLDDFDLPFVLVPKERDDEEDLLDHEYDRKPKKPRK